MSGRARGPRTAAERAADTAAKRAAHNARMAAYRERAAKGEGIARVRWSDDTATMLIALGKLSEADRDDRDKVDAALQAWIDACTAEFSSDASPRTDC